MIIITNERGFVPPIIIFAVITICIIIAAVFYMITSLNEKPDRAIDVSKINLSKKCLSRDYGGCDEEKNHFQWKDDGKP
jgi:hypothetical protein